MVKYRKIQTPHPNSSDLFTLQGCSVELSTWVPPPFPSYLLSQYFPIRQTDLGMLRLPDSGILKGWACFSPDLFLATKKWHDLACVPDVLCLSRTPLLLQLGHPRKRADKTTDTGPTEQLPGSPASEGHRLLDVRVTAENSAFESYRVRNTSGWLSFSTLLSRPKDPEQPLELPWATSQGPLPGPGTER